MRCILDVPSRWEQRAPLVTPSLEEQGSRRSGPVTSVGSSARARGGAARRMSGEGGAVPAIMTSALLVC